MLYFVLCGIATASVQCSADISVFGGVETHQTEAVFKVIVLLSWHIYVMCAALQQVPLRPIFRVPGGFISLFRLSWIICSASC